MAYTEYNLIILSHIVLAKFSITSIVVWPKKLAPGILAHEVGPGCHDRKMFVACWSLGGGRYRHLTGPAGVGLTFTNIFSSKLYEKEIEMWKHPQTSSRFAFTLRDRHLQEGIGFKLLCTVEGFPPATVSIETFHGGPPFGPGVEKI
jgi:hypothetical protein